MKQEPFPGTLERVKGKYYMTDEQEEWIRKWYPELKNEKLIRLTGMTHSTLHRFARQFGLTKTEKALKRIWKQSAKKIKRKCEKNGYYDSMRGKRPSEACYKAYQEYLHSDRYLHPLKIQKKRNPRKYREAMKRKSEERKALIRREKARVIYGLPMKTKMYRMVTIKPYTKRQTAHRHSALKRGYILMIECHEGSGERWNIYYDQDTQRAPIFERNCIKDGFKFLEYTE